MHYTKLHFNLFSLSLNFVKKKIIEKKFMPKNKSTKISYRFKLFHISQYFTPRFKSKYNEEINSLANKAKNQGFEIFNG